MRTEVVYSHLRGVHPPTTSDVKDQDTFNAYVARWASPGWQSQFQEFTAALVYDSAHVLCAKNADYVDALVSRGAAVVPASAEVSAADPWEESSEDAFDAFSEFITTSTERAAELNEAAELGDLGHLYELCLDGFVDVQSAERDLMPTPEPTVTRALKDWLRAMSIGYSSCMDGDYAEVRDWFDDASWEFDRLTRLLEDSLS